MYSSTYQVYVMRKELRHNHFSLGKQFVGGTKSTSIDFERKILFSKFSDYMWHYLTK